MGFRDDLDLSSLLSRFDKKGELIERAVGDDGRVNYVLGTASKKRDDEDYTADSVSWRPGEQALGDTGYRETSADPFRVGTGPEAASACTTIVLDPVVCWDVNGYYRALGVHWRASKKELRLAYQAREGQASVYLTYVMKQLLKPDVRRAYDRMPLGERFLDDDYVQEEIRRKASLEAQRRTRETGVPVTAQQVVEEDYDFTPEGQEQKVSDPAAKLATWSWSYYLWRSRPRHDTSLIEAWQAAVISALGRVGVEVPVVVGLMGRTAHRFAVGVVGSHHVLFISDVQSVTEEIADTAVEHLLRDLGITPRLAITA